jgi:uncharacterized membrane protein (UPF0127 family)
MQHAPTRVSVLQIFHLHGDSQRALARARVAYSLFARLRGLLGRAPLREGEGLLICPCNSLHTWGMRDAIDVVFCDAKGQVCKCVHHLPPRRCTGAWRARFALELPPGTLAASAVQRGDYLRFASHDSFTTTL